MATFKTHIESFGFDFKGKSHKFIHQEFSTEEKDVIEHLKGLGEVELVKGSAKVEAPKKESPKAEPKPEAKEKK